jgi:hypothetical protein
VADGQVLMALRGNMTQYPHSWECVPSGGLDPSVVGNGRFLDVEAQLLAELQEETGIPASFPSQIQPLGVLLNDESGVYCLAFVVTLPRIPDAPLKSSHGEYSAYEWVPIARWEAWVSEGGRAIVPVSQGLPPMCAEKGLI